jgi:hypothetical protein
MGAVPPVGVYRSSHYVEALLDNAESRCRKDIPIAIFFPAVVFGAAFFVRYLRGRKY